MFAPGTRLAVTLQVRVGRRDGRTRARPSLTRLLFPAAAYPCLAGRCGAWPLSDVVASLVSALQSVDHSVTALAEYQYQALLTGHVSTAICQALSLATP